jgi:hypothetical protein
MLGLGFRTLYIFRQVQGLECCTASRNGCNHRQHTAPSRNLTGTCCGCDSISVLHHSQHEQVRLLNGGHHATYDTIKITTSISFGSKISAHFSAAQQPT